MLICKGADSEMRDLLSSGKINETFTHIDEYANHGLRTLVIASKPISREEYENVKRDMDQARKTLENRKEVVSFPNNHFFFRVSTHLINIPLLPLCPIRYQKLRRN